MGGSSGATGSSSTAGSANSGTQGSNSGSSSGGTVGSTGAVPVIGGERVLFGPSRDLGLASDPYSTNVVVQDLNGDGLPDIASSPRMTPTIRVQLQQTDGGFAPAQALSLYGPTSGPVSSTTLAVADLNGDGVPDLLSGSDDSGGVTIRLAQVDGGYGPPNNIFVGRGVDALRVADLDGDGIPDLAVAAAYSSNALYVLHGNGDGSFGPPVTFGGSLALGHLAVGDLNGDGRLDAAATIYNAPSAIALFLGELDGGFDAPYLVGLPGAPTDIQNGDFNRDGLDDVAATLTTGQVAVLYGSLGAAPAQPTLFATIRNPLKLTTGDIDGDGRVDLITIDPPGALGILYGIDDGGFSAPELHGTLGNINGIGAEDMNGDGRKDLVLVDPTSVAIALNRGPPAPSPGLCQPVSAIQSPSANDSPTEPLYAAPFFVRPENPATTGALVDVDGDGAADLITLSDQGALTIQLSQRDGTFGPASIFPADHVTGPVVVADFDHDGYPDLAVANQSYRVSTFRGQADGGFGPMIEFQAGTFPERVVAADVNGDGFEDLLAPDPGGPSIVAVINQGNGSFGSPVISAATDLAILATGDFDHDGVPDVATVPWSGSTVAVYRGLGDGNFLPMTTLNARNASSATLIVADLNHDGLDDIVASADYHDVVFYSDGDGGFEQPVLASSYGIYGAAYDFTGDGWIDLILQGSLGSLALVRGQADGGLSPVVPLASVGDASGSPNTFLGFGDVVGDGETDFATFDVGEGGGGNVEVYLRGTDGGLLVPGSISTCSLGAPFQVATGRSGASLVAPCSDKRILKMPLNAGGVGPAAYFDSAHALGPLATGDVTGDGQVDVVGLDMDGPIAWVIPGLADGGLAIPGPDGGRQPATPLVVGPSARAVLLADLNCDGVTDLVAANGRSQDLTILLGEADGGFAPGFEQAAGEFFGISKIDFNQDGIPDLVATGATGAPVQFLAGRGNGTFSLAQSLSVSGYQPTALVADFNGDGLPDLALSADDTEIFLSDGLGTLVPAGSYPWEVRPSVAADVNGDGAVDLLGGEALWGSLSIALGRGDGSFLDPVRWGGRFGSDDAIVPVDFDGDGRSDLLISRSGSNQPTVVMRR